MSPRRNRSTSNRLHSPVVTLQQPARPTSGMMSDATYANNMKVLRRRDPSIVKIADAFSHVCVYHHNGSKWEKQGFEGIRAGVWSLNEHRQSYPPYGIYIMNRMGTDDYVRQIHPEDDMDVMGEYLMWRFYPKWTQMRIAMGLPYPVPPEQRAILDAAVLRQMTPEEVAMSQQAQRKEWRGPSTTIGLWMFQTDAREPLKYVMMRLFSYIKNGKPYPEEFHYGPGRLPPPNPHLRTASRASVTHNAAEAASRPSSVSQQPTSRSASRAQQHNITNSGMAPNATVSEVDKLFAKLLPSVPSTPVAAEVQSKPNGSTSSISVHDLFASMTGPQPVQQLQPPPAPPASRGLALLDSIFASASGSGSTFNASLMAPSTLLSSNPEDIEIVSPKPKSSALPHILSQDVISTLLGLGSDSRASSAAPSSVGSRRSGQRRYEGDNEFSEGEFAAASESEYSASSTVLDADLDPAVLAAGSSSGLPLLAVQHSASMSGSSSRTVEGDVTPRAVARGIGPFSPPLQPHGSTPRAGGQQYLTPTSSTAHVTPIPESQTPNGSGTQSSATNADGTSSAIRPRTLVPFEADSDLWPYPRAPLDDRALEQDDADVVELDFTDTRALSDPALFSSRLKEKQSRVGGKKKTRKERAADREKERREIEDSWDDPVRGQMRTTDAVKQPVASASAPAINGTGKGKQVALKTTNGDGPHSANGLHVHAARDAIVSSMSSQLNQPLTDMPRNDFVRELLTLIHTDKHFVDQLWHDYLSRVG
ncbi:predicted protein [Postia placenta Mad-698-R]|nr:predicted protein [Postia placenta Mad-698-R]